MAKEMRVFFIIFSEEGSGALAPLPWGFHLRSRGVGIGVRSGRRGRCDIGFGRGIRGFAGGSGALADTPIR